MKKFMRSSVKMRLVLKLETVRTHVAEPARTALGLVRGGGLQPQTSTGTTQQSALGGGMAVSTE